MQAVVCLMTAVTYLVITVLDHQAAVVAAALVHDHLAVLHLTLDHHLVLQAHPILQAHHVPVVH